MFVVALSDEIWVWRAISMAENVSEETILRETLPPILYALVFGFRFCVLLPKAIPHWLVCASWWSAIIAVFASSEIFRAPVLESGSTFSVYQRLDQFTLESGGYLFVLMSSMRFVVTAIGALANEFSPDRR